MCLWQNKSLTVPYVVTLQKPLACFCYLSSEPFYILTLSLFFSTHHSLQWKRDSERSELGSPRQRSHCIDLLWTPIFQTYNLITKCVLKTTHKRAARSIKAAGAGRSIVITELSCCEFCVERLALEILKVQNVV